MKINTYFLGILSLLFTLIFPNFSAHAGIIEYDKRGPFTNDVIYLAIHHTEVRASHSAYQFDAVNEYHRQKFGIKSYLGKYGGYNAFIDVDGRFSWYRLYGERTTAQLAHNFDTLSVCLAGNFNVDMPRPSQIRTLVDFLYQYPDLLIVFHRDLADRTCPGTNLDKNWLKKILREYGPGDSSSLKIHMGTPNLSRGDYLLRIFEDEHTIEKYSKPMPIKKMNKTPEPKQKKKNSKKHHKKKRKGRR